MLSATGSAGLVASTRAEANAPPVPATAAPGASPTSGARSVADGTADWSMTALRRAWADLRPRLRILEPVDPSPRQWSVLERLHARFNDREAQTLLPMPIARFREEARRAIFETAKRFGDVETVNFDGGWSASRFADGTAGAMADFARLFGDDVDAVMGVLVPAARHRKGHYAYGRFTVAEPHGLHADHSAEDPSAGGEPICIARVGTLGTHYVAGDYRSHDAETESMLKSLRHWIAVPEGEPEDVLDELLRRGTLRTMPVDHVVLMVAGNSAADSQPTQHIAARPPEGGLHSAFFQRQYKLT